MKELQKYRSQLIEKLLAVAEEFRSACLAVNNPFAPLEAGGWNAHQVAAHTRDVHRLVYAARARRTVAENIPTFENFDGVAYAAEHYDPNESLNQILDNFITDVRTLAEFLNELPTEAWKRESNHVTLGGGLTPQAWVERSIAHIEEHAAQVKS